MNENREDGTEVSQEVEAQGGENNENEGLNDLLREAMLAANNQEMEEAVAISKQAITEFPGRAEPYFVLGAIVYRYGDRGQALGMFEKAHEIDPDTYEYAQALATVSMLVGRLSDGVYFAKVALTAERHPFLSSFIPPQLLDFERALKEAEPSRHFVEASRLLNIGDYKMAMVEFSAEVKLNPRHIEAQLGLARTAMHMGRYNQAVGALQSYLNSSPDNAAVLAALSRALLRLGRIDEAVSIAKHAVSLAAGDADVFVDAMETLQLSPNVDVETLKKLATEFHAEFERENEPEPIEADEEEIEGPVRIGFLSNSFYRTHLMEFAESWFALPRDGSCEISAFQLSIAKDGVTTNIRNGCHEWREIYDIDPFTLSMVMRSEKLDVLVDLSSADFDTRAAVLGLNPCPTRVGVSALPEPGLAPGVTHILSDEVLAPIDKTMLLPGQELLTIPGSLFARPPYVALSNDMPGHASQVKYVTFGAMGVFPYMSLDFVLALASILRRNPNARALLFGVKDVSEEVVATVREYLLHAGIVDRVLFVEGDDAAEADDDEAASKKPYSLDRLEAHIPTSHWREVDIFLDTFPVSARSSVCEALWTGAPVVTLSGSRRAGRVGASILAAAGRPNWVADTQEGYVDIACRLAEDLDRLERERKDLQDMIANSPLFDSRSTARAIREILIEAAHQGRKAI